MTRRIAVLTGLYALLGGIVSFSGWALDIRRLTDWLNSNISIQPNATICVILSGIAVLLLASNQRRGAMIAGALVFFIGALTAIEWVSGIAFGIDEILMFGRDWGRRGVVFPGRMGPPGTFCWTMIGAAFVVSAGPASWRRLAPALALAALSVAGLSLIGYVYSADQLFALPYFTVIALQTSTFVMAVSIGIIVSHPASEPMCMLLDSGEAGVLARRTLPLVLVVPIAVGYLRVRGQRAGLYDTGLGSALTSMVLIAFLATLIWWALRAVREREQELVAESRQRRLITDAVPALISYVDAQGRYQFNNKAYQDWFGQSPQDLRGRHLREVLGDEAFERDKLNIESVLSGRRLEVQGELLHRDGSTRHVHAVYIPDFQSDDLVAGYYALVSDISELRKAELESSRREQAARRDEARLNLTLASAHMAAWEYDPETDEIHHTPNLGELFGLTRGTSLRYANEGFRFVHPEDVAAHRAVRAKAALEGGSYRSVFRLIRPVDGHTVWIEEQGHAARSGPGERMRIRGIVTDVSERRKVEDALRESESRLRLMADAMPQIVYVADAQGKVEFINQQWVDYTGQVEAQTADLTPLVHPDDLSGMLRQWNEAMARETPLHAEFRLRRITDGEYRWFLTRSVPVRGTDGRVVRWYGTSTDIHDRKIAEEALEDTDRRKDEFLATLAHELRNPLAPVRNAVQVLHMKGSEVPELQWARDVIDRQVTQMTRLIDDLMDVSRINRGKIELRLERVALATVVQVALETSRPLIQTAGHEIEVHLPPETLYINADLMRMAQALSNLLNNAAKYTERGGTIVLTAERQDRNVVVSVKDSGIGIPQDKLRSVFEMFSQVQGALERSQGGLGIGLALVRRIAEMHGGTIDARSEGPGKGSEFVLRLPLMSEQTEMVTHFDDDREEAMPASSHRILIVDDNTDAADTLGMIFRSMANEVRIGYDGAEAVQAAEEFRPHLVVLDIGLPNVNGYDVCRRIRLEPWGKQMVLLAVTGWGQEADKQKAMAAGFDEHLVKPVDPREIIRFLSTLSVIDPSLTNTVATDRPHRDIASPSRA